MYQVRLEMSGVFPLQKDRKNMMVRRLEKTFPIIRGNYGIRKIGIFGSYARGDQTKKSDVDILVDFLEGEATFDNFMGIADFLEELLKKKVDLLTLAGVNKYIRSRVLEEVIWIEG